MNTVDVDVTNSLTTVIGALTVLLVILLGVAAKVLGYAKTGAQESAMANKAVNNIGPGEHRLYDKVEHINEKLHVLVEAQQDFQERGWRHLPEDLADATRLTLTIRQLQTAVGESHVQRATMIADLAALDKLIRTHDEWERTQKWTIQAEHPKVGP